MSGSVVPAPRPPGFRKTYGPVPVPPPLRPVLPSPLSQARGARGDPDHSDDGDEQTTVDPQAMGRIAEPAADAAPVVAPPLPPPLLPLATHEPAADAAPTMGAAETAGGEIDIDQKSTTTETISEDSSEILLEPSTERAAERQSDSLASGTGETVSGAVADELTQDERPRPENVIQLGADAAMPVVPVFDAGAAQRVPVHLRPASRAPASSIDPALSPAWLVVQAGTDRGRRFALTSGRTSVGRGVDNDVVLTDIAVSRKHLTVEWDGTSYVMNDLGSGNGTLVNDRDEDGAYRLGHGDRLELGNTVLVFECVAVGLQRPAGWRNESGEPGDQDEPDSIDEDEPSTVAGRKPEMTGLTRGNAGRDEGSLTEPPTSQDPMQPEPMLGAAALESRVAVLSTSDIEPLSRESIALPPMQRESVHREPMSRQNQAMGRPSTHAAPPPLPPHPPRRSAPMMAQAAPPPRPHHPGAPAAMAAPARRASSPPPSAPPAARRATSPPARQSRPYVPAAPANAPTMMADAPSTGGFSPFPGAAFGGTGPRAMPVAYPSAQPGFAPNTHSAPRFQYPNGVMAPVQGSSERRRWLIGILGLGFVAVGAGIVMALVHGDGGEGAEAQASPAHATKTAPASGQTAAGAQVQTAPSLMGHLFGPEELGSNDFGTDEQAASSAQATAVEDRKEEKEVEEEKEADDERAKKAADRRRNRRDTRRRVRAAAEEAEPAGEEEEEEEEEEEAEPAADDDEKASVDSASALRRARSLYRGKQFDEAAELLNQAAESADGSSQARLRELAENYEKIGSLLGEGQSSTVSDAPRALEAFTSALRLDEEYGDSVHDRAIGARIAQVAPAAAAAHMARKDYPEAKQAADIAEKFGSGDSDRLRIVRSSLERKASELYDGARAQADAGDTEKAAETARVILRMVPRSSDIYARAKSLTE